MDDMDKLTKAHSNSAHAKRVPGRCRSDTVQSDVVYEMLETNNNGLLLLTMPEWKLCFYC